jgi:SAM-dependent methyltransferase
MNPVLHCAANLWFRHGSRSAATAVVLCDLDPKGFHHLDAVAPFAGWADWLKIEFAVALRPGTPTPDLPPADYVLCATSDHHERAAPLIAEGRNVIQPIFPPAETWENDAIRELSHHDYELGGLNEWDGAPTLWGSPTLRLMSRVHSRTHFPFWAFPDGLRKSIRAVDLGSGPMSHLRWGVMHGIINLTPVDPLLPLYELAVSRHLGPGAALRGPACLGEDLASHLPAESFDLVYTANALDHTKRPADVVLQCAQVLRPGGRLAIAVSTREGTRQSWDQFHKTDIYLSDGKPVFCHQDGPEQDLLGPFQLERVHRYDDDLCIFTALKPQAAS